MQPSRIDLLKITQVCIFDEWKEVTCDICFVCVCVRALHFIFLYFGEGRLKMNLRLTQSGVF